MAYTNPKNLNFFKKILDKHLMGASSSGTTLVEATTFLAPILNIPPLTIVVISPNDAQRRKGKRKHGEWSTSTRSSKCNRRGGNTSVPLVDNVFGSDLQMGEKKNLADSQADLATTLKANIVLITQLEKVKFTLAKCQDKEMDLVVRVAALVEKEKNLLVKIHRLQQHVDDLFSSQQVDQKALGDCDKKCYPLAAKLDETM
ncbi:uncharacterized protein HKW66_Vig0229610 [Vigna angularis]|uniref:Uncharacterized protein n=1 Tax=Phaseolus angularis TaxID=3914 RepID=A0A8T0KAQ8_PHAAN|nr:uncharacterized protein HKW66_Vig0229610 [Vigna angularis]